MELFISLPAAIILISIFFLGYLAIVFEHYIKVNKAGIALLMASLSWAVLFLDKSAGMRDGLYLLKDHMSAASGLIFFLLGAMTIVELVESHNGFRFLTDLHSARSKKIVIWTLSLMTFFMSAILDNLTTTIVMVSLLKKIIKNQEERWLAGSMVVIAANAGGAWTPIGDVTTTMLWIGGQVTTGNIMSSLFWPSLVALLVPLCYQSFFLKGDYQGPETVEESEVVPPGAKRILMLGFASLLFVPIFKQITNLPPYMGILVGLSVMWITTDLLHRGCESRSHLKVCRALTRIDSSTILFFLGILLAISALETSGLLEVLAYGLDRSLGSTALVATCIGLVSAIVDNVPLVAACMGMYPIERFPIDSQLWELVAYCAGTGGSVLVVGSAAGIAFMSLERVHFMWYMRKMSVTALLGYFAGLGVYFLIN